jgi:hypothetical protein
MAYIEKIWKDYPDTTTPIIATDMNEIKNVVNDNYNEFMSGWLLAGETWTFASANATTKICTFTISGDKTTKYQKGDKIKLTNDGSVKYFMLVANPTYSAPNTTISVVGAGTEMLVSGAITNNYYSKMDNPQGFILLTTSGRAQFNNSFGAYTTNSTSKVAINNTTGKVSLNIKKGKLVIVQLRIGGLFINDTGYSPNFDVGLDGAVTTSFSGEQQMSPASFLNNITVDGTSSVEINPTFIFKDITPGVHDFFALWRVDSGTVTAYIGRYATCDMIVTEIL